MPTFADMISQAEQQLLTAKAAATVARDESKAAPLDRNLRMAAELKSEAAARAGRDLEFWKWEAEIEAEDQRIADRVVPMDPWLLALAPRVHGEVDWIWLSAASLQKRLGMKAPRGWRGSISGEPLNESTSDGQPA